MIVGGLAARGLTELYICAPNTTITGDYYRRFILPVYISSLTRTSDAVDINERILFQDSSRVVLMQDGAPGHTAKQTLAIARSKFGAVWSKGMWPGNSPDLNPIEHIWATIQESVFIEPRPKNREELICMVQSAWKSITP